jgi:hypothetical protein
MALALERLEAIRQQVLHALRDLYALQRMHHALLRGALMPA